MDIIYKLTNTSKKEGKRFYIGSKTEADLIEIDGIPTIVSLRTSTLSGIFINISVIT